MLQYKAGSQRMVRGDVSSRSDVRVHPGGHLWKMCCGAAWTAAAKNGRAGG